ncbi:hypothetical protein [Adlercreutzia sp. ZJ242]|uniref:hypothetical protein n=1 Tax=Adlercreutzia sp. ZJ242 TaxID=2709409 RepID=UPI0013EBFD48|nr:hypothetical protein [Adlercreutzia sp. ZJ242]
MKTCPVCKTTLFDDMDVCYGCMYRFGSNPQLERKAQLDGAGSGGDPKDPAKGPKAEGRGDLRTWSVRLEVRNRSDPGQTWAVELVPPYEPVLGGEGAQAVPLQEDAAS